MLLALVRLVTELVLPPLGPFALLAIAWWVRARRPRLGRTVGAIAISWMLLFSMPGVNRWLRSPWPELPERIAPPYPPAQAIVVLGGGRSIAAPEYGGDTAGPSTLERLRYAAKLHRETGLPLLVAGGNPGDFGNRTEADIMSEIVEGEYGLPVRWSENRSRDTRENAEYSQAILAQDAITTIMLVTHASHMPRAAAEFRAAGLKVVPMPTKFERPDGKSIHDWIPSYHGLGLCREWLYERLAPLSPF